MHIKGGGNGFIRGKGPHKKEEPDIRKNCLPFQ
jgi:hypothetical protein